MKTKLFTQNSFLVFLMTLVLVFGVLGSSADALTFRDHTTSDGDLQTLYPGEKFKITIKFSVDLTSSKDIKDSQKRQVTEDNTPIDSSGYEVDEFTINGQKKYFRKGTFPDSNTDVHLDSSGYVIDTSTGIRKKYDADNNEDPSGTIKKGALKDPQSDSLQHHYNDEAVAIAVTGVSNQTLDLKKGTTALNVLSTIPASRISAAPNSPVDFATTGISLIEETKNRDVDTDLTLSSSVTLTGIAGPVGTYTITIVDVTHAGDFPTAPAAQESHTFTLYVVQRPNAVQGAFTTLGVDSTTSCRGVQYVFDDVARQINTATAPDFVFSLNTAATQGPVQYSVEGSGNVYVGVVGDSKRRTRSSKSLSTSSVAPVFLETNRGTSKVTAHILGNPGQTAIYIYQGTSLSKFTRLEIVSGDGQTGTKGGRLEDYFEVKVTDGNSRPISGVAVQFSSNDTTTTDTNANPPTTSHMFIPVSGTQVYATSTYSGTAHPHYSATNVYLPTPTLVDPLNHPTSGTAAAAAGPIFVKTDSSGVAKVYYQVAEDGTATSARDQITASLSCVRQTGDTQKTFRVSEVRDRTANLEILSGTPQSATKGLQLSDPLVVIARSSAGYRIPNVLIQFRTITGVLSKAPGTLQPGITGTTGGNPPLHSMVNLPTGTPASRNPVSGQQIYVVTGADGEAGVMYNVGQTVVARDIVAEVRHEAGSTQYDFTIDRVTFKINGTGSTNNQQQNTQQTQQTQQTTAPTVTSVPPTVSGTAGGTATLQVTAAANTTVTAGGPNDTLPVGSASSFTRSGTTYTSTVTLPSTAGTYSLSVFVGTTRYPVSVNVTAATTTTPTQTGTLSVSVPFSGAIGSQQVATVKATGADGTPTSGVSVSLSVTNGGGSFSPASVTTGTDGTAVSTLTRSTTAGTNYFVTASATGYDTVQTRISITGTTPTTGSTPTQTTTTPTQTTTTPTPTAGTPSLISIEGEATRSGPVNEELDAPLVVEVLDSKGGRVEDARVIFRVRTGQGRLSQRGNGRAIGVRTDRNGYARAAYTPLSAKSTVSASVTGVSEGVTFTITTDGAAPATGTTGTTSTTTQTAPVSPVLNAAVGVASRPPMLWISGGNIYALVGSEVKTFISGVENAISLAIGGDKLYWTEQTSEKQGTLNSANLDGTGAKELRKDPLWGVPRGIAVDTAGSKLYWVDAENRLQSSNLDGSGIQNVLRNLSDPQDLALANGNAYWTEAGGSVRFVNLTGTKNVRNISTGMDPVGSLAIAGGKVYWTEQVSETHGTLNSANLDGTGAKELRDDPLWGAPVGIAVDTARSNLYWTDAAGRLRRSKLDGSGIHNVAKGLGSPRDMVISNSITAPAATASTTTTSTTASNQYDVNGDGTVDSKDIDALIVAVAAGVTTAKYDVNADGNVDIKDIVDVRANQSAGAASAPALLGNLNLSTVQIDRLQEQIDLLIATGDRSPAALKTLVYLQQLIAMARPEKTQLLANYPNPFNPETWIPYELATDTDVRITIYNAQGVVIRTLQLGQQSAGYYTDRERAAYWDGRNALGEQVASGIYFYQLETDDMSSLRKMVILK